MKLPNFLHHGTFNALRSEMGADLCRSFRAAQPYVPIVLPIIETLRGVGADVAFDELQKLDDGTLGYKGYRVLLYIRDVASYDAYSTTLPKFHVAYCSVLERMRLERRFQRYVVANRDDGKFTVNLMNEENRSRVVGLDVCQVCLGALDWKGFTRSTDRSEKIRRVKNFALHEFFTKYPRDLVSVRPDHTSDTAPLNEYSDDWPDVSERVKRARAYRCEGCAKHLTLRHSKFLHVHHRNGLKYDNSDRNLEVLCIRCHAEEPSHGHMKRLPDYAEFLSLAL